MKTKNNVLTFILITFGFSWLFWIPEALIAQNIWNAPEAVQRFVGLNLGAWGPLVGAIVTTFIYQRFAGLKELFKRGVMVRLGKWWWVTLLIFPVLIGGSLGLALLADGCSTAGLSVDCFCGSFFYERTSPGGIRLARVCCRAFAE